MKKEKKKQAGRPLRYKLQVLGVVKGPLHVWAELLKPQSLRISQSNGRYNWLHLVSAHGSTHTLTHSHNEHTSHQLLDQKKKKKKFRKGFWLTIWNLLCCCNSWNDFCWEGFFYFALFNGIFLTLLFFRNHSFDPAHQPLSGIIPG